MSWINNFDSYLGEASSLSSVADEAMQSYTSQVSSNLGTMQDELYSSTENYKNAISNYLGEKAQIVQQSIESATIGVPEAIMGYNALKSSIQTFKSAIQQPEVVMGDTSILPPEGLTVVRPAGEVAGETGASEVAGLSRLPEAGGSMEMTDMTPRVDRGSIAEADPVDAPLASTVEKAGVRTAEDVATDVGAESITTVASVAVDAIPVVGTALLIGSAIYEIGKSIFDIFDHHDDPKPKPPPAPVPIQGPSAPQAQVNPTFQVGL